MSADKYPCIFLRQMEAIVYIYVLLHLTEAMVVTFLQIFFTARTVLKIGQYHLDNYFSALAGNFQ